MAESGLIFRSTAPWDFCDFGIIQDFERRG
jgi:hypothetical protein